MTRGDLKGRSAVALTAVPALAVAARCGAVLRCPGRDALRCPGRRRRCRPGTRIAMTGFVRTGLARTPRRHRSSGRDRRTEIRRARPRRRKSACGNRLRGKRRRHRNRDDHRRFRPIRHGVHVFGDPFGRAQEYPCGIRVQFTGNLRGRDAATEIPESRLGGRTIRTRHRVLHPLHATKQLIARRRLDSGLRLVPASEETDRRAAERKHRRQHRARFHCRTSLSRFARSSGSRSVPGSPLSGGSGTAG